MLLPPLLLLAVAAAGGGDACRERRRVPVGSGSVARQTSPAQHAAVRHRARAQAAIQHRFVPSLQHPAVAVSVGADLVNVTRDLGANNPSVQFDGTNWHYHFARGDAGWVSAFEVANAHHIRCIYFPRGTYWFGKTTATPPAYPSTAVDLSLYPNLWNGGAVDIFGDGDYLTEFTTWAPVADGPMLELSSSKSFATMAWRIHGFHFDGCSTEYSFAINSPAHEAPRAEHNNLKLFDVSFYNHLENNTCHGNKFNATQGQTSTSAKGAVYLAHIWSSQLEMGLATVATSAPPAAFNDTAGVTLNEVQYSTLSLRGAGTHTDETWQGVVPWVPQAYPGWGILLLSNVNSNTVVQTHCEGSGGCVLISGQGNFENQWTTGVMSMMQRCLIASHDPLGYNVFDSIVVNRYPTNRTTGKGGCVRPEDKEGCVRFSETTEGDPTKLIIKHMTVLDEL